MSLRNIICLSLAGVAAISIACASPDSAGRLYTKEGAIDRCPRFGALSRIATDPHDGKIGWVRTHDGKLLQFRRRYIRRAAYDVSTEDEYQKFLSVYKDVCSYEPPYKDELPYTKISETRAEIQEALGGSDEESLRADLGVRQKAIEDLKQSISALESEYVKHGPIAFLITGNVTERSGNQAIVFGVAVPQLGDVLSVKGSQPQKTLLLASNLSEEDFLLPRLVYSNRLYFHGYRKIEQRNIPFYSTKKPQPKNAAMAQKIERQIKSQREDLNAAEAAFEEALKKYRNIGILKNKLGRLEGNYRRAMK